MRTSRMCSGCSCPTPQPTAGCATTHRSRTGPTRRGAWWWWRTTSWPPPSCVPPASSGRASPSAPPRGSASPSASAAPPQPTSPPAASPMRRSPGARCGAAGRGVLARAVDRRINLRPCDDGSVGVALDETVTARELDTLLSVFAGGPVSFRSEDLASGVEPDFAPPFRRTSSFLTHEVFNRYHSEHEMLRYVHRLQGRDLSLTTSMIPLGSCTMKLNGTTEMVPLTWPEIAGLHPFAPPEQTPGYAELFRQLEAWLAEITGLAAVSLQPNAGSQGEYAGLLAIRAYHRSRGEGGRTVCLIPVSAHGTNPASAVTAGFTVVPVACDDQGNVDLDDLAQKAELHRSPLAALMGTYPSTHGAFAQGIKGLCPTVPAPRRPPSRAS